MSNFDDSGRQTIKDIPKNKRGDFLRISLSEYEGYHLVDCRQFFTDKEGEVGGTKKGFTLRVEMIDQLMDGLNAAKREAQAKGWFQPERKAA